MNLDRLRRKLGMFLQHMSDYLGGAQSEFTHRVDTLRAFIHDGADYALPISLPGFLRDQLDEKEQKAYLTESVRRSLDMTFDAPYRNGADIALGAVTDDPLYEWAWATRERVVSACHSVYQRNPLAKAGVDYTTGFVIGDGFNLVCKNPEVEKLLQAFIDNPDNVVRQYEKTALRDLQVDGEIMLRYFQVEGETVFTPLRPWECEWIETEPGFFRRVVKYHFQQRVYSGDAPYGMKTERVDIAGDEIQHIAINKHGYELRGRPELFVVMPWLRAYKEWLENRARLNYYLSAYVWHFKIANANPATVTSVAAKFQEPPTPGSVVATSDKVEIEAIAADVKANDAAEDGRQLRMMTVAGLRMAEYMIGDGENANLATATAQQLPALTRFVDFQQTLVEQLWKPMFRRVLQNAIDAGAIDEEVECYDSAGEPEYEEEKPEAPEAMRIPRPDIAKAREAELPLPRMNGEKDEAHKQAKMTKTLEAFDVSYEPLSSAAPQDIAQAIGVYVDREIIDKQTAREEAGFDHAQIEKRMAQQKDAEITDMAQGRAPIPPGMLGTPTIPEKLEQEKEAA